MRRHRLGLGIIGAAAGVVAGTRQYALHDFATLTDEGLSTEYDPAEIDAFWSRHTAVAVWRLCVIGTEVLPVFAKLVWQAKFAGPSMPSPPPQQQHQQQQEPRPNPLSSPSYEGEFEAQAEDAASRELRLRAAAVEFRLILTRLGPTFIKFGQMLSSRPDVLPTVVLQELQKLCDSVPA